MGAWEMIEWMHEGVIGSWLLVVGDQFAVEGSMDEWLHGKWSKQCCKGYK